MTGINHKQAQRYLRAAADGLLRENQRALLDAHLRECDSCRAEADELKALEARLKKNFQARWDANDGPSENVMTTIQSRSRRIIMTNRIYVGLKTIGGFAALIMLVAALSYILQRSQIPSSNGEVVATSTGKTSTNMPQETAQPFRFGVPVESKEHALIAAQSGLRTAYTYVEPLTVVTVERLSYGEYAKRVNQPLNNPTDLPVWFIVYFNNEWQSTLPDPTEYINDQGQTVPLPTEMVPSSQFRGCLYMVINADDGSLVEVGGSLQKGIMPECDK
jgi:hypothetical protein